MTKLEARDDGSQWLNHKCDIDVKWESWDTHTDLEYDNSSGEIYIDVYFPGEPVMFDIRHVKFCPFCGEDLTKAIKE